jgi:monothiol glutaredoxin
MSPRTAITQITVEDLAQMIRSNPDLQLWDVREDFEIAIGAIPGAKQLNENAVQELLERGDRNAAMIFSCHHGGRSMQAAAFFAEQGFTDVANVVGGIDAWSVKIDPNVPRY